MTHVRNAWYVAAWAHELGNAPLSITILGDRLVLLRTGSGRLAALEDRCVHRLAPLSLGRVEGEALRCMYHGFLFDTGGQVVEIPGQDMIPARARVRAYPVVECHGWAWVWMGEAAQADESLIPSLVGLGHPDYILGHGSLDYAAQARLISDNLLDFSHISYVHAQSFDLGSDFAQTHAKVTPLPRGIRYERWLENLPKNAANQDDTPVDSYMAYDYLIPGILMLQVASFEPGTARRVGYQAPNVNEALRDVLISSQAVTPMGPRSTRYFYAHGIHRRFGGEAMRDAMITTVAQAFAEDKTMIEAQQRVIDDTPVPKVLPTTHDRSVTMFHRLVDKLADAEAKASHAAVATVE